MIKYLCLEEGCDFLTQDELEATDHFWQNDQEHRMAKINFEEECAQCQKFNP